MANKARHLWQDQAGMTVVKLLGNQGTLKCAGAKKRLRDMRANLTHVATDASVQYLFPPETSEEQGRFTVTASRDTVITADGAVLPASPGSALMMQTHDCPSVIVVNPTTGAVALGQAGRDALFMNPDCLTCNAGIISNLVASISPRGTDRSQIIAHITGGISAQFFCHQHCPEKVQSFFVRYGNRAVKKECNGRAVWRLDLIWVITQLLSAQGIPATQISHDGLCTWKTSWLGSKRATEARIPDKERANWVIVLRR